MIWGSAQAQVPVELPDVAPERLAALTLLEPPAEGAAYDIDAIRSAVDAKFLDYATIRKKVPDGFFPSEAEVVKSKLLDYKKARIDVFLQGSKLHGIWQEFSVVSIDGQIRAIGLVASGAGSKATPARRWEIYGVDKNRKSLSYGDSAMPYAIMLSRFGDKFYSEVAFHGTFGGAYGSPRSKGCIRHCTEGFVKKGTSDPNAIWDNWGYHRIVWDLLIPAGITRGDHVEGRLFFGSWYDETTEQREKLREVRYKTTIFTHRSASLNSVPGWKAAFEELFAKDIIQKTLKRVKKDSPGYAAFEPDDENMSLDLEALKRLYELERTIYKTPSYLKIDGESDQQHYDRRHLDWMK